MVPAAPSALSICVLPQAAICGISARMIAGACALRRFLERLRADQHADVEQDRQDRDDRDERRQQRDDAEPGEHEDHDAGRRRIADAAAHRLPAGMADIDRVDERVAHQAADQADDAVGGQHARGREGIAGGRGALDIVHRLDEIVDAERDRGDQNDAEIFEAVEDMADGRDREREAEMRQRVADLRSAQAAIAEAEQVRTPGDERADRDRDQAAGHAAVVAHAAEPARQDDRRSRRRRSAASRTSAGRAASR